MKKILIGVSSVAILSLAQGGFAGMLNETAPGSGVPVTLDYQVTLLGGCTALSASGMTFGVYATDSNDIIGAGAGSITVDCPAGLPYRIMLDKGGDASATLTQRYMTAAAGNMEYDLKYAGAEVGDANPLDINYIPTMSLNGIDGNLLGGPQPYALTADVLISTATGGQDIYQDSVAVTVTW